MAELLNPPTLSQIAAAGRLHQRLEQWRLSDSALQRLHKNLPGFDIETCLLKSLAINVLCGTQVLAIIPMSLHVKRVLSSVNIDASGAELVDEIAKFDPLLAP